MFDKQTTKVKLQDVIKFITHGKMLNITIYRLQHYPQTHYNFDEPLQSRNNPASAGAGIIVPSVDVTAMWVAYTGCITNV
jgi:hypothetical protein